MQRSHWEVQAWCQLNPPLYGITKHFYFFPQWPSRNTFSSLFGDIYCRVELVYSGAGVVHVKGKTCSIGVLVGTDVRTFCFQTVAVCLLTKQIEELGAKTAQVTILDHPSQNLQNIYFPAMLQWPNELYHVANTLFL